MAYHGPAAKYFDHAGSVGVMTRRRNPKKKNRLPYHAKRHLSLPIITMPGARKCNHAIGVHEQVNDINGKVVTASYAIQCNVGHKATTKVPTHKAGRKTWK